MDAPNQRVAFGSYELTRKLAHGGMAEVYLAVRQGSDNETQPLVVKRILPELADDSRFLAMFINEAQLAAQMDHPNIVKVLDFGEHEGSLYMVMEYVDGLDCWRFSRRLYPWGEDHVGVVLYIMLEILSALEYVHNLRDVNDVPLHVVHRDLSPSNIYLSLGGRVKIGDFGIARIKSSRYQPIQIFPKGKFGYMAPEQVEGQEIDARADVYSAGVVLAELLIGQKLFSGHSQLSVMLDIRDGRLETLEQHADRIPTELLLVVRKALAKNRAARHQSAASFAQSLQEYAAAAGSLSGEVALSLQVRAAVELRDPRSSSMSPGVPRTPITNPVSAIDAVASVDIRPEADPQGVHQDSTPITRDHAPHKGEGQYVARLEDGVAIGPTSYAHIIELIYTDRIDPATLISVGRGDFSPAADFPELARHLPVYTPTADADEVDTPDRRGLLEIETATEVLLTLALRGESGLLICESGERRKEVYLRGGWPIYVGSNDPEELLGECLVRAGAIERADLEMALALLPKFSGHLGDTLIALGIVSAVELLNQITAQVRIRLERLMGWHQGGYEFYRGVACRQGILEVPVNPYTFVQEKLLREVAIIEVGKTLQEMARCTVAPAAVLDELLPMLQLPAEYERQIRDLSDWRSVSAMAAERGMRQDLLARTLYIALEAGLWTVDGPTPPWRES